MSTFAVEVRKIGTITPHPNANRLDIATVEGMAFQFVVGKGNFVPGDHCVYFPLDSILPDPLCKGLGFAGKLSGPGKNRVKSIRLRGEVSQGLAVPPEDVINFLITTGHLPEGGWGVEEFTDLTEELGVIKYEPEPIPCQSGNLLPLPAGQEMYDIEGCDRYPQVAERLIKDKIPVRILEKLEGTNFSITADNELSVWVNQRNNTIEEIPDGKAENMFWRVARKQGLIDLIKALAEHHRGLFPKFSKVVLRGELIGPGIQKNIYGLKDTCVRFFDLEIITLDGRRIYHDWAELKEDLTRFNAWDHMAPVLAENVLLDEWLAGRTLREASHGPSVLNPNQIREGIVITPMIDTYDATLGGRLIIKQRDPIYLDKADC